MLKLSRTNAWIMLFAAIGLEICGLSLLKVFEANPILGKVILIALMNLSYFLMSLTLRQIAVGVAYATWEIIGGIGVLLVSFVFFDPVLTTEQYFGIVIGFVGIICIILGEEHSEESPQESHKDSNQMQESSLKSSVEAKSVADFGVDLNPAMESRADFGAKSSADFAVDSRVDSKEGRK
ncbi:DMT family transporter [Helicobacter sp. T3_23-1059]